MSKPAPTETDSEKQQRLYASLNERLLVASFGGSAAEAHGIASALCCRGLSSSQLDPIADKFNLDDEVSMLAIQSLMEMSLRNLSQTNFSFDLWLPEEQDVVLASSALSQWCSGFIIALLHDGDGILNDLSKESNEAVQDIIEIAALEHSLDTDSGVSADEQQKQDEIALFELQEYVRMSAQLVYEELNPNQVSEVST